jgi:hypothetical protein
LIENDTIYCLAGRILVVDEDKNVFGFGREPAFFAQSHVLEYQLFSARGDTYEKDEWKDVFAHLKSKEASITNWRQKLDSLSVFDGLIAANEKLFLSTTDGKVICYE